MLKEYLDWIESAIEEAVQEGDGQTATWLVGLRRVVALDWDKLWEEYRCVVDEERRKGALLITQVTGLGTVRWATLVPKTKTRVMSWESVNHISLDESRQQQCRHLTTT